MVSNAIEQQSTRDKQYWIKLAALVVTSAGCLGIALQGAAGVSFLVPMLIALILGGMNGFVNLLETVELIERILWRGDRNPNDGKKRLSIPEILRKLDTRGKQIKFLLGCFAFMLTGGLFIGSGFAIIHGASFLAIVAYIGAILIGVIMIMQELEVWLSKYDDLDKLPKPPRSTRKPKTADGAVPSTKLWWWLGWVISAGNVFAVSFLFAYGLSYVVPTLVIGSTLWWVAVFSVLALTAVGGFCEVVFYMSFLPAFCGNFFTPNFKRDKKSSRKQLSRWDVLKQKWAKSRAYTLVSILSVLGNAAVNLIVFYTTSRLAWAQCFGVLVHLKVMSFFPSGGIVLGLSVSIAAFAGVASAILGLEFFLDTEDIRDNVSSMLKLASNASYTSEIHDELPSSLCVEEFCYPVSSYGGHSDNYCEYESSPGP